MEAKVKRKDNKASKSGAKPIDTLPKKPQHKTYLYLLLLGLLVSLYVFYPVLQADFVNWDDDVNIYENDAVKQFDVYGIFSTTVIGNYNPLTNLTFALEYKLFGENPFYFHLNNLLLHLINAFLIFLLFTRLGMRRIWAVFLAFLFAVHPMHVESVAWVTERKDVLFGFFYLTASLCYVMYIRTRKWMYILLLYIFFILSLLSKIQAVSLPLALLLYDYLLKRPLKLRLLIEKAPLFLMSLATGIAGIYFLGQQESLDSTNFSLIERVLAGNYSLVMYIVKSVVPYELLPIYPYPKTGNFDWYYYLMPVILVLLTSLVVWRAKKMPALVFGFLFFLVNIVFVLQFVTAGQGFMADRFSYIPYIGLFYFYITGLEYLYHKAGSIRTALWITGLMVILVYLYISREQVKVWQNSGTLFTHQLNSSHKVPTAYHNRANYYRNLAKDISDAQALNKSPIKKSIRDSITLLQNKAIEDYSNLIKLKPYESKSYVSRGRLFFNLTDYDKAFADFCTAIGFDSLNEEAYSNRASVYGLRQQYDSSLADLNRALGIKPDMKEALLNRALLHFNTRNYNKAVSDLNSYLVLVPDNANATDLRGLCLFQLGKTQEALADFEKAMALDPGNKTYSDHKKSLLEYTQKDAVVNTVN